MDTSKLSIDHCGYNNLMAMILPSGSNLKLVKAMLENIEPEDNFTKYALIILDHINLLHGYINDLNKLYKSHYTNIWPPFYIQCELLGSRNVPDICDEPLLIDDYNSVLLNMNYLRNIKNKEHKNNDSEISNGNFISYMEKKYGVHR